MAALKARVKKGVTLLKGKSSRESRSHGNELRRVTPLNRAMRSHAAKEKV